jgi:4-amino-4-deoxy-L-arabinose transferase-like glycosyltransferase
VESQYREHAPGASSEERANPDTPRPSTVNLVKVLSAAMIALALVVGAGLRVARLNQMPPALGQDEACDGYDAYSILTTGRDHHGNFMPIVMEGFKDYRMPLFQYSLVPLVGVFGLKAAVVRLGAAIWGIIDLIAITIVAGLMLGWPGGAAAAVIGALMPWHLELSRYGIEATSASATVSIAIASLLFWLRRREFLWLLLAGLAFGLSLYTYAITKAFLPLIIALIAILYWRELKRSKLKALVAIAIVVAFALPQAAMIIRDPAQMQSRFERLSLFSSEAICNGCNSDQVKAAMNSIPSLLPANFLANFTPWFLFLKGDRGDHWTMIHPPNFGELLPEQAVLVLLGLVALFMPRRRRVAILILGWLIFAAVPATLIIPLGVSSAEPGSTMPTPHVLFHYTFPAPPATPSLLLAHADSRHDALAMAPWILLSALGFVVLLDLTANRPVLRAAAAAVILAGLVFHSARFLRFYFEDFPTIAAPYFQYGIKEVLQTIDQRYDKNLPVIITPAINQPYMYVLFFEHYPPAEYQKGPVLQLPGSQGPVIAFSRYRFTRPERAFLLYPHAIFVFRGIDEPQIPPDVSIKYPDGSVAYEIVVR